MKLQKLTLTLPDRKIDYFLGTRILHLIPDLLEKQKYTAEIVMIIDSSVNELYGEKITEILKQRSFSPHLILIPPGESNKNLHQAVLLYEQFCKLNITRRTPVIAFGGGVATDLVGFAASTFMRGLPLILVPTTLLAQADAAVGGKTGVNLKQGKNLIGSFYHPEAVFLDLEFLKTLPAKEICGGMAEIVKMGFLEGEKRIREIEKTMEEIQTIRGKSGGEWLEKIHPSLYHAIQKKITIVEKDPYEKKERMILNLGHTFAHGIEAAGTYKKYSHGEAVAVGLVGACLLAEEILKFPQAHTRRIETLLKKIGLPVRYKKLNPLEIFNYMTQDKKKTEMLRFILPKKIGEVVICDKASPSLVLKILEKLRGD